MAIFGNFKGTTKTEFQIGKSGTRLSTGEQPSANNTAGDIHFNSANATIEVYDSEWKNIGETLTKLNVDNGTLFVDSANDTVSIGSTASNEKLFVNGSLRLGTNPAIKYSGAYLDVQHSNGTGTVVRVRDNTGNTDPIFKVYSANNTDEVFKVQGNTVTINNAYTLPTTDGTTNQALVTDGNGTMSFATIEATPGGANTSIQFNDGDAFNGTDALTFNKETSTLETGVVRGVIFEEITDYGLISESANMNIDYGIVTESATTGDFAYLAETYGPTGDSYTVEKLPDPAQPGQMIYVTNEIGGPTMAFSDGSNWRRIQDRAVIS